MVKKQNFSTFALVHFKQKFFILAIMKKTLSLSLTLICMASITAQVQLAESNSQIFESVKKSLNSPMDYNFIGYNNNDFYLLLGNQTLCKLNADVTQAETFTLQKQMTDEALFNFNSDYTMGIIGYVEGNTSLIFYRIEFSTDGTDFKHDKVAELDCRRGDTFKFNVCENTGQSAKSVLVTMISKNKEYKNSYVLTFGKDGYLLWQTQIEPHFTRPNFTFDDIMQTDSSNQVFVLGKSYNFHNGNSSNTIMELLRIDKSGIIDNISEECPFAEIRSMKCKILTNNNLFIAGFYKDGGNETDGGSFSALLNLQSNTFKLTAKTFKESIARGAKPSNIFESNFEKNIVGIYQLSDTNIVVIGEDRQVKITQNSIANNTVSPSYIFNAGNIFIGFYSTDGSLKRISPIYKNQNGEKVDVRYLTQIKFYQLLNEFGHQPISLRVIQSNNKLYLIFNDNIQNPVHQNIVHREYFNQWEMRTKGATFLCSIEGTTISRRKTLLINSKDSNRIFYDIIYNDSHKALALTQLLKGKNDFTFEKLTY